MSKNVFEIIITALIQTVIIRNNLLLVPSMYILFIQSYHNPSFNFFHCSLSIDHETELKSYIYINAIHYFYILISQINKY